MKLTRGHGQLVAVLLVSAIGIAWLARNTEWVQEEVKGEPRGELLKDGSLMAKQALSRLGVKVETPLNLSVMPPPGATLILASSNWDLFEGRDAKLRAWVEAGGHLVLEAHRVNDEKLGQWIPVSLKRNHDEDEEATEESTEPASNGDAPAEPPDPAASQANETSNAHTEQDTDEACYRLRERVELTQRFPEQNELLRCAWSEQGLISGRPLLWALDTQDGRVDAMRVAQGQGRITVIAGGFRFQPLGTTGFGNLGILEGDNLAVFVALLDAHKGDTVWLVQDEDRDALLVWLWKHGAPAIVLAALALAFALWRGFVRLGPVITPPSQARRSLAEQIRGTAQFLWYREPQALHAAQMRALHEAAHNHIPAYAKLTDAEQALAIARTTGADSKALLLAFDPNKPRKQAQWADDLSLLESVRRNLLERRTTP